MTARDDDYDTAAHRAQARRQLWTKSVLSGAALIVVGVHLAFPSVPIDTVALILLAAAAIPWLGELFETIETPAVNLRFRKLETMNRNLRAQVDHLAGAQESTRQITETNEARDLAEADAEVAAPATLADLAEEYEQIRNEMAPGSPRTKRMTTIVGRMIAAARAGDTGGIDIVDALSGGHIGHRLAAFAALYARPNVDLLIPVVDGIDREPKPFGQFWGLRSLARIIEAGGPDIVDRNTERRLRRLRESFPPRTDRAYELERILNVLAAKPG